MKKAPTLTLPYSFPWTYPDTKSLAWTGYCLLLTDILILWRANKERSAANGALPAFAEPPRAFLFRQIPPSGSFQTASPWWGVRIRGSAPVERRIESAHSGATMSTDAEKDSSLPHPDTVTGRCNIFPTSPPPQRLPGTCVPWPKQPFPGTGRFLFTDGNRAVVCGLVCSVTWRGPVTVPSNRDFVTVHP